MIVARRQRVEKCNWQPCLPADCSVNIDMDFFMLSPVQGVAWKALQSEKALSMHKYSCQHHSGDTQLHYEQLQLLCKHFYILLAHLYEHVAMALHPYAIF